MEKKGIYGQRTTGNGQASAIFPILLIAAFAAGIIIFYTLIDTSLHIWTLKCPLHLLTGLDCPVCGLQRAIHALLHGDIELSLKYNAFFVISLPYLIALSCRSHETPAMWQYVQKMGVPPPRHQGIHRPLLRLGNPTQPVQLNSTTV